MTQKERSLLTNKHVAIFGASSGLGAALASTLSTEGAHLYLAARTMTQQNLSFAAEQFDCDATCEEQIVSTFLAIDELTTELDFVINCIGIPLIQNLQDTSAAQLEHVMKTNFIGPAVITREALRRMYQSHSGHLIQVLSTSGARKPRLNEPGYAASKAALYMLDQSLSDEVRKYGVKLTDVITGGMKGSAEAESKSKFWDEHPEINTDGFMTTDDVANVLIEGIMKSPTGVWVREIVIERP